MVRVHKPSLFLATTLVAFLTINTSTDGQPLNSHSLEVALSQGSPPRKDAAAIKHVVPPPKFDKAAIHGLRAPPRKNVAAVKDVVPPPKLDEAAIDGWHAPPREDVKAKTAAAEEEEDGDVKGIHDFFDFDHFQISEAGFQDMANSKDGQGTVEGSKGANYLGMFPPGAFGGFGGLPFGGFGYPFPGGIFGFPRGIFRFPRGLLWPWRGILGGWLPIPGGPRGFLGGYGGYPDGFPGKEPAYGGAAEVKGKDKSSSP